MKESESNSNIGITINESINNIREDSKVTTDIRMELKENKDLSTDSKNLNFLGEKNSETLTIKPLKEKSQFEVHIINAYKNLILNDSIFQKDGKIKNKIEDSQKNKEIFELEKKKNIKESEKEISLALNICKENKKIVLNKNIMDKLSRIVKHNNLNLIFLIGKIYLILMNKEELFNPKDKNTDLNLLITFINEVINLDSFLNNTSIGINYNHTSIKFLEKLLKEFKWKDEQLYSMKELLSIHNKRQKSSTIKISSFEEMVNSINELLTLQDNSFSQYKLIVDNIESIYCVIANCDINDQNNMNNFLDLGKILAYLEFNKNYAVYLKRQVNENEQQGIIKVLFDGEEDNLHMGIIEGEKFSVELDEEIVQLRDKICDLIIKYVEKFKSINSLFEFQYVLYILVKRVYFHFYEHYKEKVEPLLAEILINLCFFKVETLEEVKLFIKNILNSNKEKDYTLKDLLNKKIEILKSNPNFSYLPSNKEEDENINYDFFSNAYNFSNEGLYLLESDLKLGFFMTKVIEAGNIFEFYVDLSEPYCILDFCMILDDYDLSVKIINVNEEKEILSIKEVTINSCPLKITMFFTKPGIFKFEFDNSYSWIRAKTIKYKINTFNPQKPFYLGKQILLVKYHEALLNSKKSIINYPISSGQSAGNMLLLKFNGQNKAYNCLDVNKNIEFSNQMEKNNNIKISSIYIDKLNTEANKNDIYFYYMNEKGDLIKEELTHENFNSFVYNKIIKNSEAMIDIVNLYIISGDSNIIDDRYISIEDILGFEPNIITENNKPSKALFFIQYLHQAQLIYSLYKIVYSQEDFDVVLLLNYNKYSGYQICLYINGEIYINPRNYRSINKNQPLNKNMEILGKELKELGKNRKIEILISESIDPEEADVTPEKISFEIMKNIGINKENEEKYKITKLDKDFNKEVILNSHIFYLDE